ncbi:MAG: peptidyl-prolyl cis-trans isomerase [Opitutaceae bacterium]|nr:peptidyl-prolyl cis-trans isomerase [Opitutaceae bacterium]
MISWIQRYFQHHFKTIFAILLLMMVIPLIWVFNPSSGVSGADHRNVEREFFGYNLGLAGDQQRLMGDAQLSVGLQFGAFSGLEPEQVQNYAFQRAASLHLAEKWHIPAATPDEVTQAIKNLRIFTGQDGQFDPKAYSTFRDNLKTNPRGMSEADIVRVLGDDVRVAKVNKLLAGPGYVSPADVKAQLVRADTTWTLATATADYAAYKPDLKPTDAELTKFFEENSFRYEIPPRVVASYVEFPSSNFMVNVNVTEAEVRAFYDANPARFPKPAEAKPAAEAGKPAPDVTKPSDPAADFAAVRPTVEAELKRERAQRLAAKTASDVALAAFEGKVKNEAALQTFLSGRKLTARPLAPFTRETGPTELGGSRQTADEAFRLNKDRFVSEAVTTANGVAVLFWKETLPAQKPLFSQVREKVAADFTEGEKRKRFVELGKTMKGQVEARLKAGDTFEKAAETVASSTGLKLETKSLPAFSHRDRPPELDYSVLGSLDRLEKGQVSDMVITADKGIFVFAAEKKVPDTSESNPRYAETRSQIATYNSRMGTQAYIAELVEKELKRSEGKSE